MKFLLRKPKAEGQVLITTLVIAGVLGLALGAFMNLLTSNTNFNARSLTWNTCIPVAEAGIEEAFAFLNDSTATNLAPRNGWTWNSASNAFYKTRTLSNCIYEVCIYTNLGLLKPSIRAIGHVPAPVSVGNGLALMGATGVGSGTTKYLSRAVEVMTTKQPMLPKGLVIKNMINFNGNNVTIDSYDAELGAYDPVSNCSDKGDVATDADIDGGVTLGNANIKGHVWVGPNAQLKWGPMSSVGSVAWVNAGSKGIQKGWLRRDSNLTLWDVPPPWTGVTMPAPKASAKGYVVSDGNYEVAGDMNIGTGASIVVQGDATVWVKGNFIMAGDVKMQNAGDRLTLYVSGYIDFQGNWYKSSDPKDLLVYGLKTCKSVSIRTGSKIECALYAPSAAITLVGTAQLFGSLAGYSIMMNGTTGFHYDESLARRSGYLGYRPISWKEL